MYYIWNFMQCSNSIMISFSSEPACLNICGKRPLELQQTMSKQGLIQHLPRLKPGQKKNRLLLLYCNSGRLATLDISEELHLQNSYIKTALSQV